ncbi:MAG: hypothetical protein LLG20_05710 [Acidobacteriales bacterium]|nr:hypothetical protein [Terriglobales bacterium]
MAVYNPELEIVPGPLTTDHVTAVFAAPATVALNCCVPPAAILADVGLILTVTPETVTVASAYTVGTASLVTRTVSVWPELLPVGAVYNPELEIVPVPLTTDQVTAVFGVPVTVALNCCVPPCTTLAAVGFTLIVTTEIV